MKSFIYSFLILGIWLFHSVYAVEAPQGLRALESSDTTISLDWDDTTDAMWYYIYYGTKTRGEDGYEVEGIDLIEESDVILTSLSSETNYYIAVSAVDEFGSESDYSVELEQSTLKQWASSEISGFRITWVEVVDETTLEFFFTTTLDSSPSATRTFILEEKDSWEEISIDLSQVNENNKQNVIALLGEALKSDTEYKVTVLEIRDNNGNTIESWIDAFVGFTTEDFNPPVVIPDTPLESAPSDTTTVTMDDDVNVTSWDTTVSMADDTTTIDTSDTSVTTSTENTTTQGSVNQGNAGSNISSDSLGGSTTQIAANTDKLPQAWSEHWVLFILALLLSAGIYVLYYRKNIFIR